MTLVCWDDEAGGAQDGRLWFRPPTKSKEAEENFIWVQKWVKSGFFSRNEPFLSWLPWGDDLLVDSPGEWLQWKKSKRGKTQEIGQLVMHDVPICSFQVYWSIYVSPQFWEFTGPFCLKRSTTRQLQLDALETWPCHNCSCYAVLLFVGGKEGNFLAH